MRRGIEHVTNQIVFTLEPSDQIEIVLLRQEAGLRGRGRGAPLHLLPLREDREGAVRRGVREAPATTRSRGDQTLFVSTREVDAGWRFIDPIVDGVGGRRSSPLEHYAPGTADDRRARRRGACRRSARAVRSASPGSARWAPGSRCNLRRQRLATSWAGTATPRSRARWRAEGLDARRDAARPGRRAARRRASIWLMVPAGAPVDELLFGADGVGRARRAARARRHRHRRRQHASTATTRRAPSGSPSSASTSSTAAPAAARPARATARA